MSISRFQAPKLTNPSNSIFSSPRLANPSHIHFRRFSLPHTSEKSTDVTHVSNASSQQTNIDNTSSVNINADPRQHQGKRVAVLRAKKHASLPVKELDRPLSAYMTLPASQYSVLDAKRIERIDEDTFRCYVGGLHFLNFHVEPVLTVSVVVGSDGPTVKLLDTQLQGSPAVVEANKKFTATMTNVVRWRESSSLVIASDEDEYRTTSSDIDSDQSDNVGGVGLKEITSDTEIEVTLQVPGWFVLPVSVIEKSGCAVMQRVLESAVPRFLLQLQADYALWASGDESRKPVAHDELI